MSSLQAWTLRGGCLPLRHCSFISSLNADGCKINAASLASATCCRSESWPHCSRSFNGHVSSFVSAAPASNIFKLAGQHIAGTCQLDLTPSRTFSPSYHKGPTIKHGWPALIRALGTDGGQPSNDGQAGANSTREAAVSINISDRFLFSCMKQANCGAPD
jgi:hypothetical protein